MSVYRWHGIYLAEWRDEYGGKKRKGFPVETEARRFEQKMRREVALRRREIERDPAAAVGKVGDLCDLWAEPQKYWYPKRVASDFKMKCGSLRLHELTPMSVKLVLNYWEGIGLADNTRSNFAHTLKRLLKYFETLPGAPRNLSSYVGRIKPYKPRKEMLTVEEERKLLEIADASKPAWVQCYLRIFLCLGLRQSEVLSLAPLHYDPESKMVRNLRTKGDIQRDIGVPTELQRFFEPLVRKYGRTETPFITLLKGAPVNFRAALWHWNDLKKKAGIPRGKRPHDLRATAITTFHVNNGNDLIATQRFAGHKYPGSTQPYLRHLDDQAIAPMIEKARVLRFRSGQAARIAAQKKIG